jgi:hypothetical protein
MARPAGVTGPERPQLRFCGAAASENSRLSDWENMISGFISEVEKVGK